MLITDKFLITAQIKLMAASWEADPMRIIRGDTNMEDPTSKGTVSYTLDFPGLIYTLQKAVVIVGIIGIMVSGIAMFFVTESKARAEKKEAILKRLFVILVASSVLTLFDILRRIFVYLS